MDRPHTTLLALGIAFTALGALALAAGVAQLAFWWDGTLSGLTIEPIVVPIGLVFLGVGLPKLLAVRRVRWLDRHGEPADAEVISVTPTRRQVDRSPVVRLALRVFPRGGAAYATQLDWPLGPEAHRLVPGRRLRVKIRPGRAAWVMPD